MKKVLTLVLALLCCVTAFAAPAEDYSGYTTEELLPCPRPSMRS